MGQNEIKISIEEENGRKKTLFFNETGSVDIYTEGIHYFSYSLGSSDLGLSQLYQNSQNFFSYLFSFYHFYGLTPDLTIGAYGQLAKQDKLFGLSTRWRNHFINGRLSFVKSERESLHHGDFLQLELNQTFWRDKKRRSLALQVSYADAGYSKIGEDPLGKEQVLVDLGLNWEHRDNFFSAIGARWNSYNSYLSAPDYSLYFQLSKNENQFGASLKLEQSKEREFSLSLDLTYYWGRQRNWQSQYSYRSFPDEHLLRTTYNSSKINRAIQIEAQSSKAKNRYSHRLDFDYTHERFVGSFTGDYFHEKGLEKQSPSGNIKLASALSFVDGKFGLSRPIGDAFALITRSGTDQAILINPSPSRNGYEFESQVNHFNGVLTQLSPYSTQRVLIQGKNNKGLQFQESQEIFVPRYKTGYHFNFSAKGDLVVKGKMLHRGKAISYNVFTLWSKDKKTEEVSFTDEDGQFWIDGISPGLYYIQWYDWKSPLFRIKPGEAFQNLEDIMLSIPMEEPSK